MRIEATIPDLQGAQLDEATRELGVNRSDLVHEALALFLVALAETRRGGRLVVLNPWEEKSMARLISPSLAAFEWAQRPESILLSEEGYRRVVELIQNPPEPTPALRTLFQDHQT